jgi:thiol-disulfide isomerase/thioredoxin
MKIILLSILMILTASVTTSAQTSTQHQFFILADSAHDNAKMLKGIIDKDDLKNDSSFKWYAESQRIYPDPDASAVDAFKNNKDKIYFIIFGGTWCEDTHFVLPKFFKIQEASDFPEDRIALFAVDRNKTTTGNIAKALNIINVPTIIVMKEGKELGRVVEYGKTGHWDKELADIINSPLSPGG